MTRSVLSLQNALRLLASAALWVGMATSPLPAHAAPSLQQRNARRERAEQLAAEGIAALERGDEAAARQSFQGALAAEPNNVAAHTYLGVLADRADDLKTAERHFAAAVAAAPSQASARNNYGAILLRAGRTAEAAAQFAVSLRLDRDQPNALANLAQIRFASGSTEDLRAARELFERAQAIAPDREIARALVVISLRLGERERARDFYRDYAARLDGADGAAAASTPAARAELGTALLEAELLEEATKLTEVYETAGYPEKAIPAMRLAIERDPRNESYRFRYGMLLTDTRAPAAAIIRLEESLRELPRSSRLWLALGVAQLAHGKNADAQKSFERALELDPKFAPAFAYLGTTYAERGQYAEAVNFYERAVAADDQLAVPYYLAADALLKLQSFDAARVEKYLRRAVVLDPSLASARMALAKLHVRGERWPEAAEQFEAVVKLDPDLAEAHYQLGRVYTRLKRTAEAQKELTIFKELSERQKEQKETTRRELVRRLADVRF
ncbi:MAG: tetratricopeptide repeat protein [Acidobacteria bacterium]|nr:tetratricopeptide repeat protein [Acidobacteriota bacterium]